MALATLFNPSFAAKQWQVYLVYLLLNIIAACVICYTPKLLPKIEETFFACSLLGFIVGFIVLLACSKEKQNARTVFVDYNNQSGWDDGVSFLVGVGTCMYAFLATDSVTHIAEVRIKGLRHAVDD
jgi:choline transport protein